MDDTATMEKTGAEKEEVVEEVKAADDTGEQQKPGDSAAAVEETKTDDKEAKPDGDEKTPAAGEEAGDEEFPPELLEYAAEWGFSEEKARKCGTAENLEEVLAMMEDEDVDARRDDRRAAGRRDEPAEKPGEEAAKVDEPDIDIDKLFPEGEMEPQVRAGLKEFASALMKRVAKSEIDVKEARADTKKMAEKLQSQAHDQVVAQVDSFFDSIEEEHGDIFGTGPSEDLSPRSRQYRARLKLDNAVADMVIGLEARGRKPSSYKVLARRALAVEFGDRIARKAGKKASSEVVEKLRKRSAQKTSPPAKQAGKEPKGHDLAVRNAIAFDRNNRTE